MFPLSKGRVSRQAHVGLPDGTFEEEHGREAFDGRATHLYRTHPPTAWIEIHGALQSRAYDLNGLKTDDLTDAGGSWRRILHNDDVAIFVSRRTEAMPYFVRDADGDLCYFVHHGSGLLETDYGPLRYRDGDFLVLPKGTTHRMVPDGGETFLYVVEGRGEYRPAGQGDPRAPRAVRPRRDRDPRTRPARRGRGVRGPGQAGRRVHVAHLPVPSARRGGVAGRPLPPAHQPRRTSGRSCRPATTSRRRCTRCSRARGSRSAVRAAADRDRRPDGAPGPVLPLEHRQGRGALLPPGRVLLAGRDRRGVHHPPPTGAAPRAAGAAFEAGKTKEFADEYAVMVEADLPFERDDGLAAVEIEGYATSWARGLGLLDEQA